MSVLILIYVGLILTLVVSLVVRTGTAAAGPPSDDRPPVPGRRFVLVTSGAILLIGLWLILSPWLYDFTDETAATRNWVIAGTLVAAVAGVRMVWPVQSAWLGWAGVPLGVWAAISPHLFGLTDNRAAFLTTLILGVVVIPLSIWNTIAGARQQPHGTRLVKE